MKTCRGAECGSDHNLVVSVVKLKLRKTRKGQQRGKKIDSYKLRDNATKERFKLELRNRFQILTREPDNEMTLDCFNKVVFETGEKVLGFKRRKKEEWIRTKTWDKIDERKTIKNQMNATKSERIRNRLKSKYSDLNKEVKNYAGETKKPLLKILQMKQNKQQ